jgi:hypothetical protein
VVWWIAGGVVVAALIVLVGLAGGLRRDLAELQRVADLAKERTEFAQRRMRPRSQQLLQTLADLDDRVDATQRRLEPLRRPRSASTGR